MTNQSNWKLSDNIQYKKKVYNCVITVGASGAVTSFIGTGIESVTKETNAGEYTIVLDDLNDEFTFSSLLNASIQTSGATLEDVDSHVDADTLSSADSVKIQMRTAGSGADVSSGNKIHCTFEVLIA